MFANCQKPQKKKGPKLSTFWLESSVRALVNFPATARSTLLPLWPLLLYRNANPSSERIQGQEHLKEHLKRNVLFGALAQSDLVTGSGEAAPCARSGLLEAHVLAVRNCSAS